MDTLLLFAPGQYGLKTAIVEKDPQAGEELCLLVGCIPTKAFLHTADVFGHIGSTPRDSGVRCDNPHLDFPLVLQRKELHRLQALQGRHRVPHEEE